MSLYCQKSICSTICQQKIMPTWGLKEILSILSSTLSPKCDYQTAIIQFSMIFEEIMKPKVESILHYENTFNLTLECLFYVIYIYF